MSTVDKLYKQHARLLKEAFQLSKRNRAESDAKYAEADQLMRQIEAAEKQN